MYKNVIVDFNIAFIAFKANRSCDKWNKRVQEFLFVSLLLDRKKEVVIFLCEQLPLLLQHIIILFPCC